MPMTMTITEPETWAVGLRRRGCDAQPVDICALLVYVLL